MALKTNQRTLDEGDYLLFFRQVRLRLKFPGPCDQLTDDGTSENNLFHAQRAIGQAGRVLVNPGMLGYTGATPSMIDNSEDEASSHAGSGCNLNVDAGIAGDYLDYDTTAATLAIATRSDNDTEQQYALVKRILGDWVELDFGDGGATDYNNWSGVVGNTVDGNAQRIRIAWIRMNKVYKCARIYDSAPRTS